jgi:hypothetical protein
MARNLLTLLLTLATVPGFAAEVSLAQVGDAWRYFQGVSEPSSPSTAWRTPWFDDSAWLAGMAGFTLAGGETTVIGTFPPVTSVYFRKTFTLADPESVYWLILRLDYSSGFVAYLNGTEVLRRGLSGDPIPFNAYAINYHAAGTPSDFDLSDFADLLVPGQNVLAVQMHGSADQPWTLVFVPELMANFQRGPYVANATTNAISIAWRTPDWGDSIVEFGTGPGLGQVFADESLTKSHEVRLTGLLPGTPYYYRVRTSDTLGEAVSPVYSFRTANTSGDLTFAVLGDSGSGWASQMQVARVLAGTGADLVLHAGDIIYPYFMRGYEDTRVLSVYGAHMRTTPYYFTFGNHELYSGTDEYYLESIPVPTNAVTGTKHFYSFDRGDAHFTCLYVPMLISNSLTLPYMLFPGSTQYQWLSNDLARSTKPWKIAFFHSPLLDSSLHRYDDANGNGLYDRQELQSMLLPLFRQHHVQAVFSGHAHDWERFVPTNGVHAFVSGGGGYTLYGVAEHDPLSAQFWAIYECLKVTIHGDTMRVQALDSSGLVFDEAVIQKAPPQAQTWQADWHPARVETAPANDGDGNILGQTFDLTGTPIPALAGDASNLGEVYVNNDPAYLYIGFKHAMIRDDANIFLFVESPRPAGVSEMFGLGNGAFDLEADGLDFLKNLGFTNFSPSVACLLGDEYADGQFRSFQRPGLTLNTGQGVFKLDPSFSDVPGIRLQQFNLSPQLPHYGVQQSYVYEQNADFIKVAIPYVALGGLQAGDSIKIAAVVGLGGWDLARRSRELDTGFLGNAMYGSGQDAVLLEGLTVRLASMPPFIDSDGDGLPDWWEEAYGLDPFSAVGDSGRDGDPDFDGFTNIQEYEAGTDPIDPDSALRAVSSAPQPGRVVVSWQTIPGRQYVLEYASTLPSQTGTFSPVPGAGSPRTALSLSDTYEVLLSNLPAVADTVFFRVRALP